MNIAVGLMENCESVQVELTGRFVDSVGKVYEGRHQIASEINLTPTDFDQCSFAIDDVTIGIGFHWERKERQVFRGGLRVVRKGRLIVINDVPLEQYVASVISSEMSASCPIELLKAHAVISRSWLWHPRTAPESYGLGNSAVTGDGEIMRWYGREAHENFDVCADDHCQRYQGITKAFSISAASAVHATAGEMLTYNGKVCDARFSKCCGGWTEEYRAAWDDREIPYLVAKYDGPGSPPSMTPEQWIASSPPAWCNTKDSRLLSQILPGFDQETRDFYRWRVEYTAEELQDLVRNRLARDLGLVRNLEPVTRTRSGRITRLRIMGDKGSLVMGKELEIRRALSRSHLYSSAFLVSKRDGRFIIDGAGWGHGVGLCQIGAAVMASVGREYREILLHYYPGTALAKIEA